MSSTSPNSVHPDLDTIHKLQLVNQFLNSILCGGNIAFNSSLIDTLASHKFTSNMTATHLRNSLASFVQKKREGTQDCGEYRHIIEREPYPKTEKEQSLSRVSFSQSSSLKFDFSFHHEEWDTQAFEEELE